MIMTQPDYTPGAASDRVSGKEDLTADGGMPW